MPIIREIRYLGSICLISLAISSCTSQDNDVATDMAKQVSSANMVDAREAGSIASGVTEKFKALLDKSKDFDVSGEVFGNGTLPNDLSGIIFYPKTTSSILHFNTADTVQILMPDGREITGAYKVMPPNASGSGSVTITCCLNGEQTSQTMSVSRAEKFAMLKLEDYEREDKPLPLVVFAKMNL